MNYLEELKNKNSNIYPINQLINTKEKNFNINRVNSLKNIKSDLVYKSIINELEILNGINTKYKDIISEVIIWSDVAKVGTKDEIKKWKLKKYNLFYHNIGSSQIYKEHATNFNEIVYVLIKTHGLVGQYIQGEVTLKSNKELYDLVVTNKIKKEDLKEILYILNECIIKDVSVKLYENIKNEIEKVIIKILNGDFNEDVDIIKRFKLLNKSLSDEDINQIEKTLKNEEIRKRLTYIFENCELWYYYSALNSFTIIEQIKILLIIYNNIFKVKQITFNSLMVSIYLDYQNIKRINIYKQRIIQSYLNNISFEEIIANNIKPNVNINYSNKVRDNSLEFNFVFSKVAKKLIEFCEVAYSTDSIYNKSVFLLYDLFGFRKDKYDRFYNEIEYLQTMNSSIIHKAKLLEYMKGENILDVGPGGGALIDLILDNYPLKNVYGIDISKNVIDELNKKKKKDKKDYTLIEGNALYLENYFDKNSMDTIIFSSIIHELFSYIKFDNKKFNYDTIKTALISAYNILKIGGRIIIRDGIMSDSNPNRIIEFKNVEDISILKKYQEDFKGRKIEFKKIDNNKVIMKENDAMEFLYTYTWGKESYALEVQEQFGYFSLNGYKDFIYKNLKNSKILVATEFLQDGYSEHLLNKISIYDENYNTVSLPNSTAIIVIEKGSDKNEI